MNFERIPKKIMKKFNPRMKRVKLDDIQYQNDDPCKAIFDNSFAENGICINIQDYIKYIDSTGVVRSTKYLPKSINPKDLYEICTDYTMIQIMGSEEKCKKKLEEITKRIVRGITNA